MTYIAAGVHWLARTVSVVLIITMLGFYFGFGGIPPFSFGFIFLALLIGGWCIALVRPALGGALALASVAAFYAWYYSHTGAMTGPMTLFFLVPTLAFLLAAALRRWAETSRHAPT